MAIYHQRYDGEWVDVTDGTVSACCDCGLVHKMDFKIIYDNEYGDRILRRAFRCTRLTADRRRINKVKSSIKALKG